MPKLEAPERRGKTRKQVRWPATWWVWEQNGPSVLDEGEVHDVSPDGVFLAPYSMATHPLWPGTRIRIGVPSPTGGEEMQIFGTVRWVGLHRVQRCGGVGIELEEPVRAFERA